MAASGLLSHHVIFPCGSSACYLGADLSTLHSRGGQNADILLSMALSEVELGRLDGPYSVDQLDLDAVAIAPRFGVVQGSLNFVLLQLYGWACAFFCQE